MTPTEEIRRIYYLSLDEILDTRLGTLRQHFPEVFEEYTKTHLKTGLYHLRRRDEFGPVTYEMFREKYALRNIETLKLSLLSNVEVLLVSILKDSFNEHMAEPFRGFPQLVINTYPYDFSDELRKEFEFIYKARLLQYFDHSMDITFIHKSNEELTADYCHNTFKGMFMYDLFDWMNAQAENFKKTLLFHTTAFTPALFRDKAEDDPEIQEMMAKGQHPLKWLEFVAGRIIPTTMVDVKLFSIAGNLDVGITPEDIDECRISTKPESPIQRTEDGEVFNDPRDKDDGIFEV
ncbi:MAG: hypothetical protein M0R77_00500 [Gammaproteobacteria bacterium]|nr:hypothetical protein [Acholeplasmataceae bacterium]MCK9529034.1 hypothetical protein [Gammaproteobacteria bacterium]